MQFDSLWIKYITLWIKYKVILSILRIIYGDVVTILIHLTINLIRAHSCAIHAYSCLVNSIAVRERGSNVNSNGLSLIATLMENPRVLGQQFSFIVSRRGYGGSFSFFMPQKTTLWPFDLSKSPVVKALTASPPLG